MLCESPPCFPTVVVFLRRRRLANPRRWSLLSRDCRTPCSCSSLRWRTLKTIIFQFPLFHWQLSKRRLSCQLRAFRCSILHRLSISSVLFFENTSGARMFIIIQHVCFSCFGTEICMVVILNSISVIRSITPVYRLYSSSLRCFWSAKMLSVFLIQSASMKSLSSVSRLPHTYFSRSGSGCHFHIGCWIRV